MNPESTMGITDIIGQLIGLKVSMSGIVFDFHWAVFFPLMWLGWVCLKRAMRTDTNKK